ncbi:MAG TPA: hypothetical protein VF951_12845 [Streptosporangiaceae bacterium]
MFGGIVGVRSHQVPQPGRQTLRLNMQVALLIPVAMVVPVAVVVIGMIVAAVVGLRTCHACQHARQDLTLKLCRFHRVAAPAAVDQAEHPPVTTSLTIGLLTRSNLTTR